MLGGLALGLAGMGIGATSCSANALECWAPLLYGVGGAALGEAIGMPIGAALSSKALGARPGKVLGNMAITAGISTGLIVLGAVAYSPAISGLGATGLSLGIPVVAGMTATHQLNGSGSATALTINPMLGPGRRGFVASARF
jgi:hypothetical protein